MGTNYYLHAPACPTCGKERDEPLHIGKSSAGWSFVLRQHADQSLNDLSDWISLLSDAVSTNRGFTIKDEYGRGIGLAELLMVILCRYHPLGMGGGLTNRLTYHMEPGEFS